MLAFQTTFLQRCLQLLTRRVTENFVPYLHFSQLAAWLWKTRLSLSTFSKKSLYEPQPPPDTSTYMRNKSDCCKKVSVLVAFLSCFTPFLPVFLTAPQPMMNAKLSKQRFWPWNENGLNMTIPTILQNQDLSFKSACLCFDFRLILVYVNPQREIDFKLTLIFVYHGNFSDKAIPISKTFSYWVWHSLYIGKFWGRLVQLYSSFSHPDFLYLSQNVSNCWNYFAEILNLSTTETCRRKSEIKVTTNSVTSCRLTFASFFLFSQ